MGQIDEVVRVRLQGLLLGPTGRGRDLRERAGLSVRELAALLGVDAATLCRWERGQTRPRGPGASRWVAACQLIENELASQEVPSP
jgi:transcriptional regulator with XRE-family HTH domain